MYVEGGMSCALQNVEQHPWTPLTRCQQNPQTKVKQKMSPHIVQCSLGMCGRSGRGGILPWLRFTVLEDLETCDRLKTITATLNIEFNYISDLINTKIYTEGLAEGKACSPPNTYDPTQDVWLSTN